MRTSIILLLFRFNRLFLPILLQSSQSFPKPQTQQKEQTKAKEGHLPALYHTRKIVTFDSLEKQALPLLQ